MDGGAGFPGTQPVSRSPEDVFRDYRARQAGLIRALTTDVEKFYVMCDPGVGKRKGRRGGNPYLLSWSTAPLASHLQKSCAAVDFLLCSRTTTSAPTPTSLKQLQIPYSRYYFLLFCTEKENLCLYGLPNETWEINLPAEEVPPELPEPALGINFARDGMDEKDWLSLVAVHSDSWLMSVAFYFGARFGFDKESRKRLFTMINNLPSIYEVVTGTAKKEPKEKTPKSNIKTNKSGSKPSRHTEPNSRVPKMPPPKDEESEEEEGEPQEDQESALCGACGLGYDDFWICCDLCETWFHGKCVKITPAKADHIKQYKCPSCTGSKRAKV
ncbi:PHD finger protein ALFIN-LIKE 8 [Zea mays]|uniref:PHD finger protein ALFIN-LIKE n=2 Tax=Zea mays TaxID=4577 RepID=A0A3L6FGA7_MAIZE|nr:hypothetical protein Zm00014a_025006 [Zea mays]PWZ32275.1 PHD finger protein ALFIN-LIKE 8 [Zea mays]